MNFFGWKGCQELLGLAQDQFNQSMTFFGWKGFQELLGLVQVQWKYERFWAEGVSEIIGACSRLVQSKYIVAHFLAVILCQVLDPLALEADILTMYKRLVRAPLKKRAYHITI